MNLYLLSLSFLFVKGVGMSSCGLLRANVISPMRASVFVCVCVCRSSVQKQQADPHDHPEPARAPGG